MKRTVLLLALLGIVFLTVGGCNKFSRKRYMTIQTGMDKLTVEKILGPPSTKFSDSWTYVPDKIEDGKEYYHVTIHFAGDKVTKKTWSDAKRGIADNPDGDKPVKSPTIIID